MDVSLEIRKITNNLNIVSKDKKDIIEYLDYNELGLAFEVLCISIGSNKIKISQNDYKIIDKLGIQMEMDNKLWIHLKDNIVE